MIQPIIFPKCAIKSKNLRKITKIRYFEGSSFYLTFAVGLLELVARTKDLNHEIVNNQDSYIQEVEKFSSIFEEDHGINDNFLLGLAEYLINNVESTENCFKVLEKVFENNESELEIIETACRTLIYTFFDESNSGILAEIRSGNDPMEFLNEIIQTLSRKFRVFIRFYKDEEFYDFSPSSQGVHLKFYLVYHSKNYSIGYSSEMCMFDENNNRSPETVKKLFKYPSEFERRVHGNLGISFKDLKLEKKIDRLMKCVNVLVAYLNEKELLNSRIFNEVCNPELYSESQEIAEYIEKCKKNQNKGKIYNCSVCADLFGENDFVQIDCNAECKVCLRCISKNSKKCLKCKKNLSKKVVEEVSDRLQSHKLKK